MCTSSVGLALTTEGFRLLTAKGHAIRELGEILEQMSVFHESRGGRLWIVLVAMRLDWHRDGVGENALRRFIETEFTEVDFLRCGDTAEDIESCRMGETAFFTKEATYRVIRL